MKRFLRYRRYLDDLLDQIEWGHRTQTASEALQRSLNGGAASALRDSVSKKRIRRFGAFFTQERLAREVVLPLASTAKLLELPIWDPTCGGGDLLLRWAEFLPVDTELEATLSEWEKLVHGRDLHPEFIEVAKRRLVLLAAARGSRLRATSPPDFDALFPGLATGDVFAADSVPPEHSTLVMNPPFTQVIAPARCSWTTGRVSQAALVFLRCLKQCRKGQTVVAILPDVLRSGSRYARWREKVGGLLKLIRVDVVGRFNEHADVDVFILHGIAGLKGGEVDWFRSESTERLPRIASFCDARVGAVVPYRAPHKGPWAPYLTTSDLPAWAKITSIPRHRRFQGSTVKPPFVAVRRTSSPSDLHRPIATIVSGMKPVALENHLIALIPHDRRVRTCKAIMRNLRDRRTRIWLDGRIRCRHLTVAALRELPVWERTT